MVGGFWEKQGLLHQPNKKVLLEAELSTLSDVQDKIISHSPQTPTHYLRSPKYLLVTAAIYLRAPSVLKHYDFHPNSLGVMRN